jgi:hypothetical protein
MEQRKERDRRQMSRRMKDTLVQASNRSKDRRSGERRN